MRKKNPHQYYSNHLIFSSFIGKLAIRRDKSHMVYLHVLLEKYAYVEILYKWDQIHTELIGYFIHLISSHQLNRHNLHKPIISDSMLYVGYNYPNNTNMKALSCDWKVYCKHKYEIKRLHKKSAILFCDPNEISCDPHGSRPSLSEWLLSYINISFTGLWFGQLINVKKVTWCCRCDTDQYEFKKWRGNPDRDISKTRQSYLVKFRTIEPRGLQVIDTSWNPEMRSAVSYDLAQYVLNTRWSTCGSSVLTPGILHFI